MAAPTEGDAPRAGGASWLSRLLRPFSFLFSRDRA
jgi:hypothetical protein